MPSPTTALDLSRPLRLVASAPAASAPCSRSSSAGAAGHPAAGTSATIDSPTVASRSASWPSPSAASAITRSAPPTEGSSGRTGVAASSPEGWSPGPLMARAVAEDGGPGASRGLGRRRGAPEEAARAAPARPALVASTSSRAWRSASMSPTSVSMSSPSPLSSSGLSARTDSSMVRVTASSSRASSSRSRSLTVGDHPVHAAAVRAGRRAPRGCRRPRCRRTVAAGRIELGPLPADVGHVDVAAGDRQVVAGLGHPPALLHAGDDALVDLGQAVVQRALPARWRARVNWRWACSASRTKLRHGSRSATGVDAAASPGRGGWRRPPGRPRRPRRCRRRPPPAARPRCRPTRRPPASRMPPGDVIARATWGVRNRSRSDRRGHRQKLLTTAVKTLVMLFGSLAS